jgi:type VI secretion system protein VasG
MLAGIVRIQLDRIRRRIADNHGIELDYAPEVVDLIVSRCNEVASGGRVIDAILTNTMLPQMSIALLERQMTGGEVQRIHVGVGEDGFTYDFEVKAEPKRKDSGRKPARAKTKPIGEAKTEPVPAG